MPTIYSQLTKDEWERSERELARRMNQERYRFYEPSGKGEDFINMFGAGKKFITLYAAANGVGKTATAVNMIAHLMFYTGENDFFDLPLFKDWGTKPFDFPKRMRIVSDPTNLEKNIIPQMEYWFPKGRYTRYKGNKKFYSKWITDTGWEIDIMTYEQSPREFEGPSLGIVWFDEPPPQAIFKANISRLRMGGRMFITGTPLAGSAYLYDQFATGSMVMEITMPDGSIEQYVREVGFIEADIESACKDHGIRGHLNHDDIMKMIAEYSEDEKQARIYGKFQHLIGMIFKKFNRKIHVIPPFTVRKSEFCVVQYLDPHPRNPDAGMWVAIDRHGTKYVVNEIFWNPGDLDEMAERIKDKDSEYRILWHKADASAFNKSQHDDDGKSLADRLAERGLYYEPASKKREMADRTIGDALNYIEVNGHMIKAPEVYVFDTCQRTIWELEHYRWDEHAGKSADKHGPKEKPVDKDDHMVENLGRALLDDPLWRPMERRSGNGHGPLDAPSSPRRRNIDDPYS